MNYVPFWNRKPDLRARRSRLRRSSSELAIEFAEPRLLLSATITGAQAGAAAAQIHDDVHNVLAAVMHTLETTGADFQQALPLISNVPGAPATLSNLTNSAHDKFFDLEKLVEDKIVTPLAGTFSSTTTTALATAFKTALETVTGLNTVTVTDNSNEHLDGNGNHIVDNIGFDFSVTLAPTNMSALSTDFLLDLNNLIGSSGLSAPVTRGTFAVTEVLTFNTNQTFDSGGTSTSHSVNNATSVTTFEATATIHPENISFGLLGLTVSADASLDYKGTITATFGTALTAASTATTVVHQTNTPFDFKISLKLSDDVLQIPGFTQVVNGSGLELSGPIFGGTTPDITVAFTGFESLENLAKMSPTELLNVFANIDGYINQLTQSSLLNIEFPLTNGATVGSVINFAAEFKADVLDKLGSVDAAIGLDHSLQSSTAIDGTHPASVFIAPPDPQHISLPESFRIELTVNGKLVNLDITNPYLGAGNAVTKITTLSQLETAIAQALPAALQAAGLPFGMTDAAVTVGIAGGRIVFTATPTLDTAHPATIVIHTPGTAFTDLVTFAKNLSSLLGYGDLITNGTLTLKELLAGIGLHFDSTASTLEFQLNYSTHIPAGLSVLGFDGAHRAATNAGGGNIGVAGNSPVTDPTSAFAFNIVVNGHAIEIDIAADPTRTELASAITAALNKTLNRTDLGLTVASGGPTTVNLGSLIQVSGGSTVAGLVFTAAANNLTPDHPVAATPLLAVSDVNAISFNVGFDLGALGGLALSNGTFSFDASAGIGLTIGIKAPPANNITITEDTPLDSLPIWPTGAVTADQITNPSAVVRADIGLGADAGKGLKPSDVELLSHFITVTDNGSVLTFTANAASLTPVSGQPATVSLQGNGAADLGFTVGQSGVDDGTHSPFTLTAANGIADYTKEFLFNLVVNGHAVRVDVPAGTAHSLAELTTAINAVLGAKTGQPDLTIYLRDGGIGTIEFRADKAIGGTEKLVVVTNGPSTDIPGTGADNKVSIKDLKTALALINPNLTVEYVFDTPNPPHSIIQLQIVDKTTSSGFTPETLGFSANQSATAQKVTPSDPNTDPSTLEYKATLIANPDKVLPQLTAPGQPVNLTPDFTHDNEFLLSIGTLTPVKVHVAHTGTTAADYAHDINTALGGLFFTNAQLGLSGTGTVSVAAFVHADVLPDNRTLTLTLNMHGVPEISVNSNDSNLRAEAKFGFTISTVDTLIAPTNGSLLAQALGINGFDTKGLFDNKQFDNTTHQRLTTSQGEIDSAQLKGGTLSDRIYVRDASLYAQVGLHISGSLSGTLGFLGFTANAHGDIFLKTSLALQNPDGGSQVTFHKVSDAFTDGTLADLWAFNIGSGKANTPWAQLTIDNFHVNGNVSGLAGNNFDSAIGGGFITLSFDGDLTSLGNLLNTRPTVTYTDFALPDLQNLSFSKIVAGIETVLNLLDNTAGTSVLTTDIPLIGINLESILHFTTSFANFVDELQNQPASALDKVTQAIQTALGTTAVSLTISAQGDLLLNFNTTPLNASTTLPLTLDLKALAAAAGVSLPDSVANLASANGTLAITAGATIGISLGIRLSPNKADSFSKLTDLNKGAGAAGDGTSAADLRFVLGNGRSFTVNIDDSDPTATVQSLLDKINMAAHDNAGVPMGDDFVTFANGHFVFTDTSVAVSQVNTSTLTDLGFNSASRTGVEDGTQTHLTLTAAQAPDPTKEYTFNLVINGHAVSVDVGPGPSSGPARDIDGLVTAIRDAMNNISVDRSALNLNGSGQVTLGFLVTAGKDVSGHVTLTAAIPDIASTAGPTSLSIHDIDPVSLVSTLGLGATTHNHGLSVITATSAPADYGLGYRFDVVFNGHAVTVDIAENGARATAAAFAAAVSAAIGETLVDKTALGLTGSGKISLGQLVTASLNNSGFLTFTAFDAKFGSGSLMFQLQSSAAHSQTVALEVIDLNNSGGAGRLGLGTGSGTLDLHLLAPDPASRIDTTTDGSGNLSITLTPVGGTDYSKALAFDLLLDGHPITVLVAASANRDINGVANAINAALARLSVDRHEFGLNGTGTTTLDKLVTVTAGATQLTLTAAASNLSPTTHSLEIRDIAVTTAMSAGLSGNVAGRSFTGKDINVETDDDLFFVNTRAPDAMTDPGSGIVVRVGINATNLAFNTSFGPLSASIKDGTATLGTSTNGLNSTYVPATNSNGDLSDPYVVASPARVGVGLVADSMTPDKLSFTSIGNALSASGSTLTSLFDVSSNVAIKVDLPFYLVGIPAGHVIVAVSDILGTNGGIKTFLSLPTDFADHFSAFNFLNNPQAIINGLDALLSTTDSLFQDQVFGFKLPLIGDALSSAGNFIGDLRANVIGYLQGLVDDYEALHPGQEPTTASIISDGLSSLLGSLGFAVPNGTFANVVTSKVDPVAESITFDLNIQKTLFFGSVDLSTNLGIPGLGINIQNGKIDLSLILNMSLEFGYAAIGTNQGFFFNDTLAGSHAVALSVLATLPTNPPASVTANLGIITLSATNSTNYLFADALHPRGTLLDAGVYVDLHPKTTAALFDLGFTKTTLDETVAGVNHVVTAGLVPTLISQTPITFNVSVNGHDYKVVTTPGPDIVAAINSAMAGIQVAADVVGGSSSDPSVTLGSRVTAGLDGSGHLKFTSTDTQLGGPNGHLAVSDVKLTTSDVPKSLRVDLQAHADLNLILNANINLGGSIQLPSVSTELIFEYQFAKLLTGFNDGTFTNRVVTPITFKNVTLDVGPFLTGFLKPILDIAEDVLGPITPILDFITSPLPGISDLIGTPTSLVDLAQTFGGSNPEVRSLIAAIQVLDQVANLVKTIKNLSSGSSGSLMINFGTYVFASGSSSGNIHYLGTNIDPLAGGTVRTAPISSNLGSVQGSQQNGGGADAATAAAALNQLGALSHSTQGNGKLSLPILESPVAALKLLTGQLDGIDLFTWELPTFIVGLSGGKTFPVVGIPGIGISAGLTVDFAVGLHVKFGYDTTGLVEFLRSNNPVFLLDGFYVDNTVGPQLTAHFGIGATASLDLVLVRAGITGSISGDFGFTLLDPNDDGRVRPVEILDTLLHDPLHIFVIDGAITASVTAWWWVGVDTYLFGTITLYEGSKTLISGTLVSFHYAPDPVPILATLDSSGTLNIDMGPLANQRAHAGDNVDNNEIFTITHNGGDQNSESVLVDYQLGGTHYTRTYSGVKAINVDGGVGNNSITLNNIQTAMTVNAGDGNNSINLNGSTGKSTIIVGDGNNYINGGNGIDTITAGAGNNRIFGNDGADVIKAGAGANFVSGGAGNDQITVGGGRNVVIGGLDNNTIRTGNGNNVVIGGVASAATVTRLENGIADSNLANFGEFSTATAATLSAVGTTDGMNTIRLGSGNNIVFGGSGDDTITAGSGNNVVLADVGTVQVAAGGAIASVSTTDGGTPLTQGGNDFVRLGVGTAPNTSGTIDLQHLPAASGTGNQIILGGGGNDILIGTNGTNIIFGDFGSVDGPGAAGPNYTITTLAASVGGIDGIVGGVGADVLFGGGGNDVINSASGDDIIAGDEAMVVRNAAIGPTAAFVSFESQNEDAESGWNDKIDGSTGGDLVIGGGGGDIIDGGSGNNVLLGDFGIIVPTTDHTKAPSNPIYVLPAIDPSAVFDVKGHNTGSVANGNDTITATNGYNVIMGGGNAPLAANATGNGTGNDIVTVGDGNNLIFGDSGWVKRQFDGDHNPIPVEARVVEQAFGGNDLITTGRGNNVVIGGAGNDQLNAGGGSNVLLGDFGTYRLPDGSTPDVLGTDTGLLLPNGDNANGNDTITVAGGNTVALGGGGNDTIIANKPLALDDLFGVATGDRVGVDNGTAFIVTAPAPTSPNLATRYTFDVVINGYELTVDVGSDTGRTKFQDLVDAINTALSKITPLKSELGLSGNGTIKLSQLITVSQIPNGNNTATTLTFTALDSALAPVVGTASFALRDAPSVNALFGDSGSVKRTAGLDLIFAETADEGSGGSDNIQLNYGKNVAFGGAGNDTITIHGSGINVALGDNGIVTTSTMSAPDIVLARNTGAGGADTITVASDAISNNIVLGGVGDDTISVNGNGNNVAFGDSGQVKRAAGTLAVISATTIDDGTTLDESIGGADTLTVNTTANGNNVLIGGAGQDTFIIRGTGKNIVLGDLGTATAATMIDPDTVTTRSVNVGTRDDITVESTATGINILIGAAGDDQITINGPGANIAFGDGGIVRRAANTLELISAETIEQSIGGQDTFVVDGTGLVNGVNHLGNGANILIGGTGNDIFTISGDGRNVAIGDLGIVTAATVNTPEIATARDTTIGGVDTFSITGDAGGNNVIMGGALGESITVDGTGDNIIFGDSGQVLRATGTLDFISAETVEEPLGAADGITINGPGKNVVLGGAGGDTITIAGIGNNVALGDFGLVRAIDGVTPDVVGRGTATAGGAADTFILTALASGNNIIMGESGDENITSAATGFNIYFGDTGSVTRNVAGQLLNVRSVEPDLGGADTITINAGSSVVIGGAKNDTVQTFDGIDYIIGDNGSFTFINGVRSELRSTDFTVAGNDTINAGGGENYVIGGGGNDVITAGSGTDVIFGDQGKITWAGGIVQRAESLFDVADTPGNDTLSAGDGSNYIIGGGGNDTIAGGSDRDQLIGDQGFVVWNLDGTRNEVSSLFDTSGSSGADVITGGNGNDNIIGGLNADLLYGDAGSDIIFGDDGHVTFVNDQERMAETLDQHFGTGDILFAGSGNNFLFGGEKNNQFYASPLADLIVITYGHVDISEGRTTTINIPPFFGDPLLTPLGRSLEPVSPGEPGLQPLQFAVIRTGNEGDGGVVGVFGNGPQFDPSSIITSTLLGQAKSAFNLEGFLSGNIAGTSLLNLLAIGPSSLIEAVTFGDVLDSQQNAPANGTSATDNHTAIEGVLAQAFESDETPAMPPKSRPILVEVTPEAVPTSPADTAAAMVFDEERGLWIRDIGASAGPRLILNGVDLPMLDLSSETTMAA